MSFPISIEKVTTVTLKCSATITGEMIREAFNLPPEARVFFGVPGGGNWSNCAIEIDHDTPVSVEWQQTSESVERTEEQGGAK